MTVEAWRKRLGARNTPRYGLVWAGNANHRHDCRRSIPLRDFAGLLPTEGQFYCLQKALTPADKESLTQIAKIEIFGEQLQDFADTAALIALMDLVITVDTAVAHLAAAMGKPVWILLPFQADWRWQTTREDSPCYPGARLFRQTVAGDWNSVLKNVRDALTYLS